MMKSTYEQRLRIKERNERKYGHFQEGDSVIIHNPGHVTDQAFGVIRHICYWRGTASVLVPKDRTRYSWTFKLDKLELLMK